jgi:hypothetical protein
MKTIKYFSILILMLAVLLAQAGSAFAQEPITNTVTALACGTDGTTVLVTYDDGDAVTPEVTVEVSLEDAVTLGLIASGVECTTEALADGVGTTIDPADLTPVEEEPKHPVALALSLFFANYADYDAIIAAHEDGAGFGLIAQALWMTKKLDNSELTFDMILKAKKDGDYSGITLPDGSAPQNWGQFKKAVLNGDKQNNLGAVMSDKPDKPEKDNKDKGNNGNHGDNNKNKP